MGLQSENLAADGSTSGFLVQPDKTGPRPVTLILEGDFGTGSIAIEVAHEDVAASYVPTLDSTGSPLAYTEEGAVGLDVAVGTFVRATLSGATAPDLNVRFLTT